MTLAFRTFSHQLRLTAGVAVLLFIAFAGRALAIDPAAYRAKIDKARTYVSDLLNFTAQAENGERVPVAEHNAVENIRAQMPIKETVEWQGQTIETSNEWLHSRLALFEKEPDTTKRAINLTEIDELLSALSAKLAPATTAPEGRSKDEDKRKLAEILARAEYQKPAPKEARDMSWIGRLLEWIRSFFPENAPESPAAFDFSTFAKALQILLFAIIFGLIAFGIYKFAPLLFPKIKRSSRVKKSHRTILGESIAADESSADLFSEAERLAREGEIRAAIRKGYIALLCELSDKHVIALEQHKTNRDYLRDVRSRRSLHGSMRGLTSSFERHWYGFQPTAGTDWETFRESYKKAVADV